MPVKSDRKSYVKQIKDVPTFDGTKAKFPAWKRIFRESVDNPVADEGMSALALHPPQRTSRSTS